MIPQIPKTLLTHWLNTGVLTPHDTVFDPFCGSGTTVVEARLHGLNAVATDINPFACLLARTKSTPGDVDTIEAAIRQALGTEWEHREQFIDETHDKAVKEHETQWGEDISPEDPATPYYQFAVKKGWFPERQLAKIESMRRFLSELRGEFDYKAIRFLRIALSQTAREISYQRRSEFKRHRIPEDERAGHSPAFTETFVDVLTENFKKAAAYAEETDPATSAEIKYTDCRDEDAIAPNSADVILTSPPYGDSRTTVGYGE